jgi:23S rRNA (adenine2503-C2)-methyltransferase
MNVIMTLFSSLLYLSLRHSKFVDGFTTSFRNNLRIPFTKHTLHTLNVVKEQISNTHQPPLKVNLLTIHEEELQTLLQSWKQPKYRAKQIIDWVKEKGVSDFDDMNNLPKTLRNLLKDNTTIGTLKLDLEMVSKDGTRKRAYRLHDGQLIESVLMPYEDGRNTACISSQAGCAMACSFCATGQMGFARQLSPDEIYEQVARFSSELRAENKRLSNVVMMGMGEPLANYRNVIDAIKRMNTDLGIGARKITVSTVGIVPNIKKLIEEDIQVRLAVSLHCASEDERSALLPANKRYGGLDTLMETVKEYIDRTNRRVTFEWALIENGTYRGDNGSLTFFEISNIQPLFKNRK